MWQSIRLQREPFETEINEEVEKEYQRLEEERAGEDQIAEKSIADISNRMDDLEAKLDASNERLEAKIDASNERLEAKIDASHSRLEAMFQQLLASRTPVYCTPPVSPRDNCNVVSVMLPIVADEPRSTGKEKELTSPKPTKQAAAGDSQAVAASPFAEGPTVEQGAVASAGLETGAPGAGPSSAVETVQAEQVS